MVYCMDAWLPHLLTKLDHLTDLSRDLLELQHDNAEVLERIEMNQSPSPGDRGRGLDWQKIIPTIIWGMVLFGLLALQIPLKDAVQTVTKLSSGL